MSKTNTDLLKEIKNVFKSQINNEMEYVTLYDVSKLLKYTNIECELIKRRWEYYFDNIVKSQFGEDSSVICHDFDYRNKILKISFKKQLTSSYEEIDLAKHNGELFVLKSRSCWSDEVFQTLSSDLSNLYDELLKFEAFKLTQPKNNIKPINSEFNVKINADGVIINNDEIELFVTNYDNDCKVKSSSNMVKQVLNETKDEIFKRIFIKISDCPVWMQSELQELRHNQLKNEKRKIKTNKES